jgi:hypothetical protein
MKDATIIFLYLLGATITLSFVAAMMGKLIERYLGT